MRPERSAILTPVNNNQRDLANASHRSRFAATRAGHFILTHELQRPERYGAFRRFETAPSRPRRSTALNRL